MCMLEVEWVGKIRGIVRKGVGVGRICRVSGSMLRNLVWILWVMGSFGRVYRRGVRRWDVYLVVG